MGKVLKGLEMIYFKFPEVEIPRLDNEGHYNVSAKVHLDEYDDLCFCMMIEGCQEKSNPDCFVMDEAIETSRMTEEELLSLFNRGVQRLSQRLKDPDEEAFFADNYL